MNLLHKYKGKKIAIGIHGNIMTNIMNYFDDRYDINFWKTTTKVSEHLNKNIFIFLSYLCIKAAIAQFL